MEEGGDDRYSPLTVYKGGDRREEDTAEEPPKTGSGGARPRCSALTWRFLLLPALPPVPPIGTPLCPSSRRVGGAQSSARRRPRGRPSPLPAPSCVCLSSPVGGSGVVPASWKILQRALLSQWFWLGLISSRSSGRRWVLSAKNILSLCLTCFPLHCCAVLGVNGVSALQRGWQLLWWSGPPPWRDWGQSPGMLGGL